MTCSVTEWINDKDVCRTASAAPGLLIIGFLETFISKDSEIICCWKIYKTFRQTCYDEININSFNGLYSWNHLPELWIFLWDMLSDVDLISHQLVDPTLTFIKTFLPR